MAASGGKVDMNDPQVRKLVYNMYRGILGSYNDQANSALVTGPEKNVVQDRGVYQQIESMAKSLDKQRQTSQSSSVGSPAASSPPAAPQFPKFPSQSDFQVTANNGPSNSGFGGAPAPPPPPPPPPPPLPSGIPAGRVASHMNGNSVNHAMNRGGASGDDKSNPGGGAPFSYMPPSAIQNAMMTKDKKPFSYTPAGIDLSEIRSPRMAKRIQKNAMMDTAAAPPPPPEAASQVPSQLGGAPPPPPPMPDLMSQPMVKLPSFIPPKPGDFPTLKATPHHSMNRPAAPAPNKPSTGASIIVNGSVPQRAVPVQQQNVDQTDSESDSSSLVASGVGSLYIPAVPASSMSSSSPAETPGSAGSLRNAPLPWMSSKVRQNSSSAPSTQEDTKPAWRRDTAGSSSAVNGTRVVPIQIETQSSRGPSSVLQNQQPAEPQRVVQIPVQVGGAIAVDQYQRQARELSQGLNNVSISQQPQASYGEPIQSRSFRVLQKLTSSDDVADGNAGSSQGGYRKLELSEDDRRLMNHVKEKVNDENYLHEETDPRYRGAYIPSRAFRMLQDMTTSEDAPQSVWQRNQAAEATNVTVPQSHWRTDTSQTPSRSFRLLQQMTATDPKNDVPQQQHKQPEPEPANTYTRGPPPIRNTTTVPPTTGFQRQTFQQPKPSYDQNEVKELRYTGAHIPSRTFKYLQEHPDTAPSVFSKGPHPLNQLEAARKH